MSHMTVQAAIFVQAGHPLDLILARLCIDHCLRRGYEFVSIFRDLPAALHALETGEANAVVMMPSTWQPERQRKLRASADDTQKFAGGTRNITQRLPALAAPLDRRNASAAAAPVLDEASRIINQARPSKFAITAYRDGYSDGYVDCAMLQRSPE